MTNQLANQVQPLPAIDEHDPSNVSERSQSGLNFTVGRTAAEQQVSVSRGLAAQSLRRKYLIGWLASGVLSVATVVGVTAWFNASTDHLQGEQASTGRALTEQQQGHWQQITLLQQILTIALVLSTQTGVMLLLYRAIAKPIKQLQQDTQMFALGAREIRADVEAPDEIAKIAQAFNKLAESTVSAEALLSEQTRQRARRAKKTNLIGQIAGSRVRTVADLDAVFEQAVQGAKAALEADRVVIYRFYADWSGYISAEAVAPGLPIALADKIEDACISNSLIEAYHQGRIVATNDVFNAGFHPEHLKLMTKLHIKANLVTPILKDGQLYGLLIAHHCAAHHHWQPDEIDFLKKLAIQVGLSLDRVTFLEQKEAETERAQQLHHLSSRVRNALSLQEIYNLTVRGVRETLNTDRAIVYLFDEKWHGTIVAEAVVKQYPTALGAFIANPCFAKNYVEKYKQGRVQALEDITKAGLTACHLAQLEPFKVRANLVAPILASDTLHGLLIVHQCSRARPWKASEITFFQEVAAQVGLAIDRVTVLNQLEQSRQQAEQLAEDQRYQREALQQQLVGLLLQVEGAASGNLTVRADVKVGEIGTVADFFNAIIESLRQIVVQVKRSATQVNTALGENETTILQLVSEALKQSEDITQTLTSVDQMTTSIQAVAESAHQAAAVTHTASAIAEASQEAIDITVHSIYSENDTLINPRS